MNEINKILLLSTLLSTLSLIINVIYVINRIQLFLLAQGYKKK